MTVAKTKRQLPSCNTPAAMVGARAEPRMPIADHSDTTEAWRSSGNNGNTAASEDGRTMATPMACTTREAITRPMTGATADNAAPRQNTAIPAKNTRRRPQRSARRPPSSMNVTWVTLKADTTQDTVDKLASGKAVSNTGMAMLEAVVTKLTTNIAPAATTSAWLARRKA